MKHIIINDRNKVKRFINIDTIQQMLGKDDEPETVIELVSGTQIKVPLQLTDV